MSAAESLEGLTLQGVRRGRQWIVRERLSSTDDASLGYNSSVYYVEDEQGNRAFLKASDIGMISRRGIDTLAAMQMALSGHLFERNVLDFCQGNSMDRVVTAIDHGDTEIVIDGTRDHVFFLVFERANGDLRKHVVKNEALNMLWAVTTLHNLFVATSQLHGAEVAHNDIKPANALVFSKEIQKIADLGRATTHRFPAAHDAYLCAGDSRYAPPEQLYPNDRNCAHLPRETARVAGDLYNLGSLAYFVLSGRGLTSEIIPSLRPEHRPKNKSGGSGDSFQAALPYWREALMAIIDRLPGDARAIFGPGVDGEISRLVQMVRELGDPDPMQRGHPQNRSQIANPYDLGRYVTMLDLIKKRLVVKSA